MDHSSGAQKINCKMILSIQNISEISKPSGLMVPEKKLFTLPEKVLQFGTGVLLRGLPDFLIDKANRNGIFNGRVIVVKSTDKGGTEAFSQQNGLYTVCIRGLEDGKQVDGKIINASISRVLSAKSDWLEILSCAYNSELKVIISNTTETGIKLSEKDLISASPPSSFPGKLLAFLYERYKFFKGSADSGMVILPTELIPDNGKLLKSICIQLAELNQCEAEFIKWLTKSNDFCNTLVDRIVPGALPEIERKNVLDMLGYEDDLMIMAEPYCLWAIETSSQRTKEILSFSKADAGVILAENISKYREIKLRLLNAPHTFICALAIWCGYSTVREAMLHTSFRNFISQLMHKEIIPAIAGDGIEEEEARIFAAKVLDRFANPFISHKWLSISLQYTSKILMRCIPILLNYYKRTGKVPLCMSIGFASYILFMNSKKNEKGEYIGKINEREYIINDEKAAVLYMHWQKEKDALVVNSVLKDESLWNTDLTNLFEFEKNVLDSLEELKGRKMETLLQNTFIHS
jgi:tagaturonate reductase